MEISEVKKFQSFFELYGYGSLSIHSDILFNRLFALSNLPQEWPVRLVSETSSSV